MKELNEDILKNIEIYAFAGKLGSGKNYLAEKIFSKMLEPKPTVFLCFADQIKIDGIYRKGLDRYKCWIKKDDETRNTLQQVGTEEGRDVHGKDIWINNIKEWMIMHAYRGAKRIIVSDLRFQNEFDFIKSVGGYCINVTAPNRNKEALEREATDSSGKIDREKLEKLANHSSETSLDSGREFDYEISNDFGEEHNAIIKCRNIIRDLIEKQREEIVIFCDLDNTICECDEFYTKKSNVVKGFISQNLQEPIPEKVMNKMFDDSFRKHNDHFNNFFTIESFSDSLVMVLEDFKEFMVPMKSEDYAQIKKHIYDVGMSVFDENYRQIKSSLTWIKKLQEKGHVVIYTMGSRLEQVKKIAALGLSDLDFEIYDFKDETIYRNLKHRYPAKKYFMIGDSYLRDIEPAIQVGMTGFYMKTNRPEFWYNSTSDISKHPRLHCVDNLKQVYEQIDKESNRGQTQKDWDLKAFQL